MEPTYLQNLSLGLGDSWYHSKYPKEWFVLFQIRGRVVALRYQIHGELGHTIDLIVIWLSYANSLNSK